MLPRILLLMAVFGIVGVMTCSKPDGVDDNIPPAPEISLTGTWNTQYGDMVLVQTGDSVHGHYDFRNGSIEGTVSGTDFITRWWETVPWDSTYSQTPAEAKGPAQFTILREGDSLEGTWKFEADTEWRETRWWAIRLSDTADTSLLIDQYDAGTVDSTSPLRSNLSGTWDSDMGDLMMKQSRDSVRIWYGDPFGYFKGTISGHVIKGRWWETDILNGSFNDATPSLRGDAIFVINADEDGLAGKWRYENDTTDWNSGWDAIKLSDSCDTASLWDIDTIDTTTTTDTFSYRAPGIYTPPVGELLFVKAGSDSTQYFFYGDDSAGVLDITHVSVWPVHGSPLTILFSGYLPVMWMTDTMVVAVYNYEETGAWDPSVAFHAIRRGPTEDSLTVDLTPGAPDDIVSDMETEAGVTLPGLRQYLIDSSITSFGELVTRVQSAGVGNYGCVDDACAFGVAAASLALNSYTGDLAKKAILTQGLFRHFVTIAASWFANMVADEIRPEPPPGAPTLEALRCEGASSWVICHYMFYPHDAIIECANYCLTSMRCFSCICIPCEITISEVKEFRKNKLNF